MSLLSIGLENIDLQINNKLADELTDFFRSILDKKKQYVQDNPTKSVIDIVNYIQKEFNNKDKFKLKDIIVKHTNMNLINIKDSNYGFAIQTTGKDLQEYIIGLFASQGNLRLDKFDKKTMIKMISLIDSIDLKNAKFKKLPIKINYIMYFDISFAFLTNETSLVKNTENIEPTPEEITAIVLHEIGHSMTMLEYVTHVSYTGYYSNNIIYELFKSVKGNKEDIQTIMKKNKKYIEQLYNRLSKTKTVNTSKKIKDMLSNIYKAYVNFASMKTRNSLTTIILLSVFILAIGFFIAIFIMEYLFGYLLSDDLSSLLLETGASKESGSQKQTYLFELLADEFVSKFNYSRYLNSGLNKVYKYEHISTDKYTSNLLVHKNRFFLINIITTILRTVLILFKTIPMSFLMFSVSTSDLTYERLHKRLERNIQFLYNNFKNSKDLSEDMKIKMINELEVAKLELKKLNQPSSLTKSLEFVLNWILMGNAQKALISGIFGSGNTYKEIRYFLDQIDKLCSNSMYYHSTKFDLLFKGL